jgi:hypothetical protein
MTLRPLRSDDILAPRTSREVWDHERGLIIHHEQDVEPLLAENHADRSSGNNGYSPGRTMRRIGSIPNIFLEQAMNETGINVYKGGPEAEWLLRKILRDNYFFRTVDKL